MPFAIIAGIGSALIGADASQSAARTQAKAADRAAELQNQQFKESVRLQEPWRQSGIAAQNELLTLLGIDPGRYFPAMPSMATPAGPTSVPSALLPTGTVMDMVRSAVAPGAYPGAAPGGVPAQVMDPTQYNALAVDPTRADFGKYARDFSMADFEADPGYGFRMSEGMKALERSAAARGGLLSGGAGKALQRFGQDLASQEYTNAFNRYQTNRANRLNPLQSLAGVGQTTAQQVGQQGMTMAQNVGEAYQNAANARASGYVGTANALTSALGQGLNYYQNQQYLNKLNSGGSTGGFGGGFGGSPIINDPYNIGTPSYTYGGP